MKDRAARSDGVPERESKRSEFKAQMDVTSSADWCELIKDIVAMANSGGGSIVLGLENDGSASGWDPSPLLALDPAHIIDKIAPYVGWPFAEITVRPAQRAGKPLAVIAVRSAGVPMVFTKPGTYELPRSAGAVKQKTAFGLGTLYFRHGAKSEPASPQDLRMWLERTLENSRRRMFSNFRKVAYLPAGYEVKTGPAAIVDSSGATAAPVRLVHDASAPPVPGLDPNKTHPYRLMELLKKVNAAIQGKRRVNPFDIKCIRAIHSVSSKVHFFYKPKFGSPQYSDAFADWIVEQYEKDPRFFDRTRGAHRRLPIPNL
jgi:hypothetical protein